MILSETQYLALEKALSWFKNPTKKQIFYLAGFAGTGKTTIVKAFLKKLKLNPMRIAFCAFTGKAALALSNSTNYPASTIHKLIKRFEEVETVGNTKILKFRNVLSRRELEDVQGHEDYAEQINHTSLIILDECSMVNKVLLDELLNYDVPILALGDPGQLPPVAGNSPFENTEPDCFLTEIHRQALESPILKLATAARLRNFNEILTVSEEAKVIPTIEHREYLKDLKPQDQILCGTHKNRIQLTLQVRRNKNLTEYPKSGEPIVCMKNNHEIGIYNGEQFTLLEDATKKGANLILKTDRGIFTSSAYYFDLLEEARACTNAKEMEAIIKKFKETPNSAHGLFDFGYVLTVHKAQGSQWDRVLLFDDSKKLSFKPDRTIDSTLMGRWLYTGITRAAKELIIFK